MTQGHLRLARPTDQLEEIATMYENGLGFSILASSADHDGFDGIMLGHREQQYHLEFTRERRVLDESGLKKVESRAPSDYNFDTRPSGTPAAARGLASSCGDLTVP